MSLVAVMAFTGSSYAWCVLNDSVLPLAIFGEPAARSTKEQIENLKAEIKCREQKKNETWIHARSATQFSWLVNISIGVLYPRRLRGRVLRSLSIFSSSLSVTVESGRDLGMYCRMSPFRFSFDPRCQLEYGSAKEVVDPRALSIEA